MERVRFEDIVTRVNTKEDRFNTDKIYYVGGEHIESNDIKVHQRGIIKGSTIGPMFYCGFKAGDVLFVTRNPHLRKCAVVDFDGICSEKTFVLGTKDSSRLLQEYLPLIMQSDDFWAYCEENKSGGVNFFVNWSTLANYEFDLPSLEEQRVLADKLWAAYEVKESYKNLLAQTDKLLHAQFQKMFGDGSPQLKIKDTLQESFSGEWGKEDSDNSGVKVLRTTNFTNNGILDYSNIITRIIDEDKLNKKKLLRGDIILERSGGTSDNPVGRVVYFDAEGLYLCNNFTQVLRSNESVNSKYLFYNLYYYYQDNKSEVRSMGSQTTGIQNLSLTKYYEVEIPVPPMKKQLEFVSIAEQAERTKASLNKGIEAIEAVIRSLIAEGTTKV